MALCDCEFPRSRPPCLRSETTPSPENPSAILSDVAYAVFGYVVSDLAGSTPINMGGWPEQEIYPAGYAFCFAAKPWMAKARNRAVQLGMNVRQTCPEESGRSCPNDSIAPSFATETKLFFEIA